MFGIYSTSIDVSYFCGFHFLKSCGFYFLTNDFHFLAINHVIYCKIACANAGDARKWMEAFDHAKQLVDEISQTSVISLVKYLLL